MAEGKRSGCLTQVFACVAVLVALKMCSDAVGDKPSGATAIAPSTSNSAFAAATTSTLISPKAASDLAIETVRGEMPEMIGGCCLRCLSYAKRVANDPDSIECVQSTIPQVEGDKWTTTMMFRGKNGFGALILNKKKFLLQNDRVVGMQ